MVRRPNVSEYQFRLEFLFSFLLLNFNGKPFYDLPEQIYSFQLQIFRDCEQKKQRREMKVSRGVSRGD